MTFSRIKTVGWQVNEKVTSGQLNQMDLDHSRSLDKTGDNSTNGGGISGRVDVLSGATFEVNSGGQITVKTGSSITVTGGIINWTSGGEVFNNSTAITFNDSAGFTFNGNGNAIFGSSASLLCAGTLNITSGGTLGLNAGADLHVKSGAELDVDNGGSIFIANGGGVDFLPGSQCQFDSNSFLIVDNQQTTFTGVAQLVTFASSCTVTVANTAFLTIANGGTLTVASGANNRMSAFPTFIVPQSRNVIESTTSGIAIAGSWSGGLQFVYDNGTGGVWGQQLQRTHHGATLNQIFVGLSVGSSHSSVPAVRPSLSLIRYHWTGMFSPQALSTTDPQYFPNPGSGAAYYNGGNQQYLQYVCNQNNVIDNENYIYVLTITDESGAGSASLNAFGLIYQAYYNIPNLKWNI